MSHPPKPPPPKHRWQRNKQLPTTDPKRKSDVASLNLVSEPAGASAMSTSTTSVSPPPQIEPSAVAGAKDSTTSAPLAAPAASDSLNKSAGDGDSGVEARADSASDETPPVQSGGQQSGGQQSGGMLSGSWAKLKNGGKWLLRPFVAVTAWLVPVIGAFLKFTVLLLAVVAGLLLILAALALLDRTIPLEWPRKTTARRLAEDQQDMAARLQKIEQEVPLLQKNDKSLQGVKVQLDAAQETVLAKIAAIKFEPGKPPDLSAITNDLATIKQRLTATPPTASGVKPAAEVAGEAPQPTVDAGRLESLEKKLDEVSRVADGLKSSFEKYVSDLMDKWQKEKQREARKEAVCVVFFHSSRLNANPFRSALQDIFQKDTYRTFYKSYVLALYLAADGVVTTKKVEFGKQTGPENFIFDKPSSSATERTDLFVPDLAFPSATKTEYLRRLVLIASSEAEPPRVDDAKWKDFQVYAILIDVRGRETEGKSEKWKRWQDFCVRPTKPSESPLPGQPPDWPSGEASMVSFQLREGGIIPPEKVQEFESRLRWYVRPLPPLP